VCGTTSFDASSTANDVALMSILAECHAVPRHQHGDRGGLNGTNKLNWTTTVKDDTATNTLTGAPLASALDWFFQGVYDTINNFESGERQRARQTSAPK
jgi:hypothetical protein